jgi:pimeloyl-ACP methyl ester carboxylesterase
VIFAHGSGSSRLSSRNKRVAAVLQRAGLATLLFDLLTAAEEAVDERTAEHRFNIPLLAGRLADTTKWLAAQPETSGLEVGYFGASTGAAAALIAAAIHPGSVAAVVSRGGRPDLAGPYLRRVIAPTLLIVGDRDEHVLDLNMAAKQEMVAQCQLRTIRDATHLFEEPGALDEVAALARDWFLKHLGGRHQRVG